MMVQIVVFKSSDAVGVLLSCSTSGAIFQNVADFKASLDEGGKDPWTDKVVSLREILLYFLWKPSAQLT